MPINLFLAAQNSRLESTGYQGHEGFIFTSWRSFISFRLSSFPFVSQCRAWGGRFLAVIVTSSRADCGVTLLLSRNSAVTYKTHRIFDIVQKLIYRFHYYVNPLRTFNSRPLLRQRRSCKRRCPTRLQAVRRHLTRGTIRVRPSHLSI